MASVDNGKMDDRSHNDMEEGENDGCNSECLPEPRLSTFFCSAKRVQWLISAEAHA